MTAPARPLLVLAILIVSGLLLAQTLSAATSASDKRAVEQATELWKAGDADAAIAFLQKLTESGGTAEAYHLLGQIYFKAKKKPREAAEAFVDVAFIGHGPGRTARPPRIGRRIARRRQYRRLHLPVAALRVSG